MITFYAKGKDLPNIYCISVSGEKIVRRYVADWEWRVAEAAGQTLAVVAQKDFDRIPKAAGSQ